ncbi:MULTISPECIES: hypothetical protein [Chryseobacterium]|uniref:Lipocalin-like domain-containing protein n=1 Tax=Chryseobacterium pennae TaxID=2258962 RepID=A0A3D9C6V4_9FLAO|nr:hypothetical protein [Chryseobacterium pennae]REC61603.1 hypothetical protein DRF65_14185 [Chryseobacterium pennae]
MLNIKRLLAVAVLLSIYSCSSNKLIGSWEFIELYEGTVPKIDTLKNKQNRSRYGTGILSFHPNNSFDSKDLTGNYQKENNLLKMKYNESKDTIRMKIAYINKDYLLLSSMSEKSDTWFYKKIKAKK